MSDKIKHHVQNTLQQIQKDIPSFFQASQQDLQSTVSNQPAEIAVPAVFFFVLISIGIMFYGEENESAMQFGNLLSLLTLTIATHLVRQFHSFLQYACCVTLFCWFNAIGLTYTSPLFLGALAPLANYVKRMLKDIKATA